jgi:hypothetical protein
MYRFPLSSTATESTPDSWSCTAGIPSVLFPVPPCPATVVIVPDGSTLRTRPFLLSAMYIFPDASRATLTGPLSCACWAGPPSPLKPALPFPATVVMFPPGANFLTLLFCPSAMYIFPAASDARPETRKFPCSAGPLSPGTPAVPGPATSCGTPLGMYFFNYVPDGEIQRSGSVQAKRVGGDCQVAVDDRQVS